MTISRLLVRHTISAVRAVAFSGNQEIVCLFEHTVILAVLVRL
jgi:hypothetical protein